MSELFTAEELRQHLIAECEDAGGQAAWARDHGLSQTYVSKVFLGKREASDRIAMAMGLRRVVMYEDDPAALAASRFSQKETGDHG